MTATSTFPSSMVTITYPCSSLRNTLAPVLCKRSRVSGVGYPYGVSVWVVRADLYDGYLRREATEEERVEEVLEP